MIQLTFEFKLALEHYVRETEAFSPLPSSPTRICKALFLLFPSIPMIFPTTLRNHLVLLVDLPFARLVRTDLPELRPVPTERFRRKSKPKRTVFRVVRTPRHWFCVCVYCYLCFTCLRTIVEGPDRIFPPRLRICS